MRLHNMVVIALCATTAAACKGRQTAQASDNTTAAAPGALTITSVELGRSIDAGRRIQGGTTTFRRGDTIYAVVATSGSSGGTLQARWMFQDGQVVNESSQPIAASPDSRTEFHISKPDGWPSGRYRLELLHNGAVVQSKEFEVSR